MSSGPSSRRRARAALGSRQALRNAVLWREILGPPKALQPDDVAFGGSPEDAAAPSPGPARFRNGTAHRYADRAPDPEALSAPAADPERVRLTAPSDAGPPGPTAPSSQPSVIGAVRALLDQVRDTIGRVRRLARLG